MFGSSLNQYNVQNAYTQPTSSYLPYPSGNLNQQLTNQQNSQLFGNADLRNLMKTNTPQSNAGVSTDYKTEPGMMANLVAPRAAASSQAAINSASNPYQYNLANFNSLLGLQNNQSNGDFSMGDMAQQLGQGYQNFQLGNYGNSLNLIQSLFGGLLGGLGSTGGTSS